MAMAKNPAQPQTVDLHSLPTSTLTQLKSQLDTELSHLTSSFSALRTAQAKFRDCIVSIREGIQVPSTGDGGGKDGEGEVGGKEKSKDRGREGNNPGKWGEGEDKDDGEEEGRTILVPLTTSLYVPARLADRENVIVDIGTGFYVEKSTTSAISFYTSKIDALSRNLKDLDAIVQGKGNNLRVVEDVLRQKMVGATESGGDGAG